MVSATPIIIAIFVAFFIIGVSVVVFRCGWYRSRPSRRHHDHFHRRHVPFRNQRYDSYLYAKSMEDGSKSIGSSNSSSRTTSLKSGKDSVKGQPAEPEKAHVRQ